MYTQEVGAPTTQSQRKDSGKIFMIHFPPILIVSDALRISVEESRDRCLCGKEHGTSKNAPRRVQYLSFFFFPSPNALPFRRDGGIFDSLVHTTGARDKTSPRVDGG